MPFEALQARDESALNRLLAASLPESVDRALTDADKTIEEKMAAIIASVPADRRHARRRRQVDARQAAARPDDVAGKGHQRGQKTRRDAPSAVLAGAGAQAFPDGIPQERALGGVALLNRYGPALVQRLVEELPLDPGHHWVLTL